MSEPWVNRDKSAVNPSEDNCVVRIFHSSRVLKKSFCKFESSNIPYFESLKQKIIHLLMRVLIAPNLSNYFQGEGKEMYYF